MSFTSVAIAARTLNCNRPMAKEYCVEINTAATADTSSIDAYKRLKIEDEMEKEEMNEENSEWKSTKCTKTSLDKGQGYPLLRVTSPVESIQGISC